MDSNAGQDFWGLGPANKKKVQTSTIFDDLKPDHGVTTPSTDAAAATVVQSGHRDKDILGPTRVPYDLTVS